MEGSAAKVFGILVVLILVGYEVWFRYFRKCPRCGGKIRLDEYKDSMGHNITKTVTISFWKGPRKNTEIYKCRSCGETETKKYWSWS